MGVCEKHAKTSMMSYTTV